LNSKNSAVLEGKYSSFKVIENLYLPYVININNAQSGQSIEIDYKKIEINKPTARFNIEIPDDATKVEL
jgi:outer membrane lipoprotein-sorting protein